MNTEAFTILSKIKSTPSNVTTLKGLLPKEGKSLLWLKTVYLSAIKRDSSKETKVICCKVWRVEYNLHGFPILCFFQTGIWEDKYCFRSAVLNLFIYEDDTVQILEDHYSQGWQYGI